ncbi:hypothetical protein ACIOEW_36455 [Streptomyces sp. NPDC087901]|uniref:hypothetical protein n=1 Tax=Streptomyces sp. NPDC087901 TaxID=3365818 RepID=UPI0038033F39
MARKPVTWYIATPTDGTIEMSRLAGTPVGLSANVGKVIDHPNPCHNQWYDESRFSYFRMVKRVGEALEDTGTAARSTSPRRSAPRRRTCSAPAT